MRIILFLAALIGAFIYADRYYMVAKAATGGPQMVAIAGCDLPRPSEKSTMAFASYYEGASVSTERLGDPNSTSPTGTLELHISRGFGPLYIVIAGGRPSILRVTGWTRRVERLVVIAEGDNPIGVTGLPKSIVTFASASSCGQPIDGLYKAGKGADLSFLAGLVKRPFPASMDAKQRAAQKTQWRMPDAVGGGYDPERLTISEWGVSADIYKAHDHAGGLPDWYVKAGAADFDPGGIAEIDQSSLIAPVPAATYAVLPGRAGIGQLLKEGKLEQTSSDAFTILAPIEIPQGLCGSESVRFTLGPNAPYPSGALCHSHLR